MNSNKKLAPLTKMLRSIEFVYVGLCADHSVRVGCRGRFAQAIQYPVEHTRYNEMLALGTNESLSNDDFESAVMGVLA
jgi:hypothetical protein